MTSAATRSPRAIGDGRAYRDDSRPRAEGKFIEADGRKFYARGVTYGPFRPGPDGAEFPTPEIVDRDLSLMVTNGVNTVRLYTIPPPWLLEAASTYGLRLIVGIPWEQHVAFLADPGRARAIERQVRESVRTVSGHPAILCYAIGNEIPAGIVRWHGRKRIERFVRRLYRAAKVEDPEGLVTYVNYPTTEYLDLPFIDLVCFNVFLESAETFEAYVARLQNIAGERPLILTELGMDARRNGEIVQARGLDWQVRGAFEAGCAGVCVFSWTDEWHRGGEDVLDWGFGLVEEDRRPRPALAAVAGAFRDVPFPPSGGWPRISVVVCTYNGSRTIRDCLEGLARLDYPDYEVVVVNDGSRDGTEAIVSEYRFRMITTENRGLSSARNTGLEAASGEIVAYLDDDAYPDPHWLRYLALAFRDDEYVGVGGPNILPPDDPPVAQCVANAPGGPVHVLLSDTEAEHIPGCNMAFRAEALRAIGGFDPRFWVAGDDVDVCWRLRERGWKLAYSPAAVVWHHRRDSLRAYWRQQREYGKAEGLLETKWPERYNGMGHVAWSGRIYGRGVARVLGSPGRIYQGTFGSAPFQSLYGPAPRRYRSLPLVPEWYLMLLGLALLVALGAAWTPLLWAWPALVVAVLGAVTQAALSSKEARYPSPQSRLGALRLRVTTALLHLLQPVARLTGRLSRGLHPLRGRPRRSLNFPRSRTWVLWSEGWRSPVEWITLLNDSLRSSDVVVLRSGPYDHFDLEVRDGAVGTVRVRAAVEEHGKGRQLLRIRSWPRWRLGGSLVLAGLVMLSAAAGLDQAWLAAAVLGAVAVVLVLRQVWGWAKSTAAVGRAVAGLASSEEGAYLVPRRVRP